MFAVQKLFHLTQIVDDLDEADRWYNHLFAPCRFYRGYMKEAMRHASLLAIGDATVVEPVQLADEPGAAESPLGRFRARFGSRLHSIAWYVDDLENAVETLLAHDVRLVDVTGRPVQSREQAATVKYVWTHPKDSFGPLEFARLNRETTIDPRVQRHWSASYWREKHPLGIGGALRITVTTRNPGAAARFYREVLGASEVAPLAGRAGPSLQVGSDSIVDLLDAADPAVGDFGEGVFGMSFQVRDIERAEGFLRDAGLAVERRTGGTLLIPSAQALGTTVGFHMAQEAR